MSESESGVDAPELSADDFLVLADDRYSPENVAVVTGAASGIGRATALAFAANGLTVLATDVDADGLAETASMASGFDVAGSVVTHVADLTDGDACAGLVDAAADEGDVRFVANIAGLQHVAPIEEFPTETFDTMQDVMVRAPFLVSKHAMTPMREAGGGVVANMASIHGHYVTSDKVAYNTAKFAIRGLTQSIAAEGEGDVRSFSVSTGYVKTPLVVDQIPDTARERDLTEREVVEDVMLGEARTKEMMTPAGVANLFVFGCSNHGSHLNGGDMLHDGGYTLTY